MKACIEKNVRLSESLLWPLQQTLYQEFGPDAWRQKGVPSYLTSHPLIAKQYAQVVLGYLRDMYTTLDLNEPIYFFDLGAGTGRFAWLFLSKLKQLLSDSSLENIKFRYVMTDIVTANMEAWAAHPFFQEWLGSGELDFAFYHNADTEEFQLIHSNTTIQPNSLSNPPVIIANYFFDTIPQDLFRVKKGVVEEGKISLYADDANAQPSDLLQSLDLVVQYEPLKRKPYEDERLNKILESYSEASFSFPIGAFRTLDFFSQLCPKGMLLLASDQGLSSDVQLKEWKGLKISKHGAFSLPVGYHPLAEYFRQNGGLGLLTNIPDAVFAVMVGVFGNGAFKETQLAFREQMNTFEPHDYWKLGNALLDQKPGLDVLISMLKLGEGDPLNLYACLEHIQTLIPAATPEQKEALARVVLLGAAHFFPISQEEFSFFKQLGSLMQQLGGGKG